jgi:iron uptake system EfeUOB component EfeO/EfeM
MSEKEDLKVPNEQPTKESNSTAEAEKRAALIRMAQILQEYQEYVQNQLKDFQQSQ